MLLNFKNNSHQVTLSKLFSYWKKNFSLEKTKIEFLIDQNGQSYLYDYKNIHEFESFIPKIEEALKNNKIWSLPILFYFLNDENKTEAFQFIVFDGSIKGFDEEQTKQCFGLNPDYLYKSSAYLMNRWNFKKIT